VIETYPWKGISAEI